MEVLTLRQYRFTSGDFCPHTNHYMIFERVPNGLRPTGYRRFVRQGDPFPPAPGPGHCFMIE